MKTGIPINRNITDNRSLMRKAERGELPPGAVQWPKKIPLNTVLKAANTLGLPERLWKKASLRAINEVGEWLTVPMCAQIAMVSTMDSLEQVHIGFKVAREIAESQDGEAVSTDQKLLALNVMAAVAKAHRDLTGQLMELVEKSQAKLTVEKPKNLPPMLALQVNVGDKEVSAKALPGAGTPANSGLSEPESEAEE